MQYLHDYSFLKQVDQQHIKTLYVQIEVLGQDETSLAMIEGICTGGSISLNAKSSMRRSGSLQMVANQDNKNITQVDNLISINKRISIQIGVKNDTGVYVEQNILWFPMGVFIITSANISKSQNGINISISFKDKMVLLNGEVEGSLSGPVTHSPVYVEDSTSEEGYKSEGVRFYNLIHSLVTEFGNLPSSHVIIDDVNLRNKNTIRYTPLDTEAKTFWIYPKDDGTWIYTEKNPGGKDQYKFSTGSRIGYQYTDFIYPLEKDLTSQAGESVESVLKTITKQLVNYEYFFDVHGIFHFQEIKNGLNQGSNKDDLTEALEDKYLAEANGSDKVVYTFDNDELFTALTVNPQYQNIKNAFVCWGEKKGTKTIIRYHLIIDTPPKLTSHKSYSFYTRQEFYSVGGEKKQYTRGYQSQSGTNDRTPASIVLTPEDDWRIVLYYELLTGARQAPYAKEYIEEFPKQYDIIGKRWLIDEEDFVYYLDMLDPLKVKNPVVAQLGVNSVGYRLKAENQKEVNAIKSSIKTPNVILIDADDANKAILIQEAEMNNQQYVIVPHEIVQYTTLGSTEYTAYDYIRSELHSSLSYLDTIQISCIPIYYLEPGQRIHVTNHDVSINGDYIIQTMSIPLTVDGVMSINATRAIERI